MKFLFDNDVPDELGHVLRHLGHEVHLLREVLPRAATDNEVFEFARSRNWILITCNRDDFLALAQRSEHPGMIILIRRRTRLGERVALIRLLETAGEQGIAGNVNFA